MKEPFSEMLTVGGKTNSLGRAREVIEIVLKDKSRLDELYDCLSHEDAWVRMRAADALEKVCRQHPDWLIPYIDRLQKDFSASEQPSIQWHLAEIYIQVKLTDSQKKFAIDWLSNSISSEDVDWIVSANSMKALAYFNKKGYFPADKLIPFLKVQQRHKSKAVVKRANKLIDELSAA